jgi:hypothetical protein
MVLEIFSYRRMMVIYFIEFLFIIDIGLLFVVVSDMNIITRGKTYLSNIKLPWEE